MLWLDHVRDIFRPNKHYKLTTRDLDLHNETIFRNMNSVLLSALVWVIEAWLFFTTGGLLEVPSRSRLIFSVSCWFFNPFCWNFGRWGWQVIYLQVVGLMGPAFPAAPAAFISGLLAIEVLNLAKLLLFLLCYLDPLVNSLSWNTCLGLNGSKTLHAHVNVEFWLPVFSTISTPMDDRQ